MERVAGCTHHPTEEAAAGLAVSAGFTLWGSEVGFITDETYGFWFLFFFKEGRANVF